MATIFGGSRLANLREKRTSGDETAFKKDEHLKLDLPFDQTDKGSYQPSSISFHNRTQTRLLKGRIDRPTAENQQRPVRNQNLNQTETAARPKLSMPEPAENLRLVINDDPAPKQDRRNSSEHNPLRTTQKRILIAKEPEKEHLPQTKATENAKPIEQPKVQIPPQKSEPQPEKPQIFSQDKPIKEEQVEESMQGEADLVQCPQGCGRKFNRKALEKHAKACKLVFMSKRKEFNSEAKRIVTKEQAAIVKQQKLKQKKEGKGKGFEKTSDNWKSASQDFRAAVKAIKKEVVQQDGENVEQQKQQQEMKIIPCSFCDKPFAEVFLQKHLQVCAKKREAEKKKTTKKK